MWHARIALNETLISLIVGHVKNQRPSLFNYATPALEAMPGKLCIPVPNPSNGARRITRLQPLEIGRRQDRRLLVEYCYQFEDFLLDFTPNVAGTSGVVLKATLHVGFGVPDPIPETYLLLPGFSGPSVDVTLPFLPLQCTKVTLEARGSARWISRSNRHFVVFGFDSLELKDSTGIPALTWLVKGYVLPKLNLDVLASAAIELAPIKFEPPSGGQDVFIPIVPDPQQPNPAFANNSMSITVNLA